ncbi:DoxX protein [Marisediminitalea aggregata]|uniref:DoxX protein n=1 Tax=Marisediminitalea aggregata TaxID=634436 RepID=A0A1M5J419_9ALTE|nr:DoxX family protein [Marisediminitalea aggregata]SHG35271.1 DoxX protein [Marisediminitalea aggregata]
MIKLCFKIQQQLQLLTRHIDGVVLLLIRLYLAPVMVQAGWQKLANFDSTVQWFGDAEFGLGLPFPYLLAILASLAEFIGGLLLVPGLAVRWVSIPLLITMIVAMVTVHAENGWLAIADSNSWLADGTLLMNPSVMEAPEKLAAAKSLLEEHGYIEWLTSSGNFVILNNGIEFAATYFVMLLVLLCFGAGRYTSIDYYLSRYIARRCGL